MNKVDLELEEFMKFSERRSHKYKRNKIEWLPYAKVWIHRRWLLKNNNNNNNNFNALLTCRRIEFAFGFIGLV
jgi:hypothetical protein